MGPALRDSSSGTVHRRWEAQLLAPWLGERRCEPSAVLHADACRLPGRARGAQATAALQQLRPEPEGQAPGLCLSACSVSGVCRRAGWLRRQAAFLGVHRALENREWE